MAILLYTPLLIKGALVTLGTWLITGTLSILLGTFIGIFSCQQLSSARYSIFIKFYTFIAKGVPAYVQILIAYFVIPALLGVNIPGFIAAIGALAFCSTGYVIEIVRAGLNTIAQGQWEACTALGYSTKNALCRIILPQAFANISPALFAELEQLLKSTSLLATVGITELTRSGMNIISRELNPMPVYLSIACIYLAFSALLQVAAFYIEKNTYGYR